MSSFATPPRDAFDLAMADGSAARRHGLEHRDLSLSGPSNDSFPRVPSRKRDISAPSSALSFNQLGHHPGQMDPMMHSYPPQAVMPPQPTPQLHHPDQSAPWTTHDDEVLTNAKAAGLGWNDIHQRYFPAKSGNACRKRHERLMQRIRRTDWDDDRIERVLAEYNRGGVREDFWSSIASRVGERWEDCEREVLRQVPFPYESPQAVATDSRLETRNWHAGQESVLQSSKDLQWPVTDSGYDSVAQPSAAVSDGAEVQAAEVGRMDQAALFANKAMVLGRLMTPRRCITLLTLVLLTPSLIGLNVIVFYLAKLGLRSHILVLIPPISVYTLMVITIRDFSEQQLRRLIESKQLDKSKSTTDSLEWITVTAMAADLWHVSKCRIGAARVTFSALHRRLVESPAAEGFTRVRYQCGCGANFYDDYPASLENEAQALQGGISKATSQFHGDTSITAGPLRTAFVNSVLSIGQAASYLHQSLKSKNRASRTDHESQKIEPRSDGQEVGSHYLTCFPRANDRRPLLDQVPERQLRGDKCYFTHLRQHSIRLQRYWTSLLVPRKITSIRYVQFQLLHDNKHVDIIEDPNCRFPTDVFEYSPVEQLLLSGQSLYVGPNTLLHYYEKPHDCCADLDLLGRIPKKLKGRLQRDPQSSSGPVPGWGMQLVDGIDYKRLGLSGFIGLLMCAATGVVWTSTQTDVQGGMAIAQCMMMVVTYIVTLRGISEDR